MASRLACILPSRARANPSPSRGRANPGNAAAGHSARTIFASTREPGPAHRSSARADSIPARPNPADGADRPNCTNDLSAPHHGARPNPGKVRAQASADTRRNRPMPSGRQEATTSDRADAPPRGQGGDGARPRPVAGHSTRLSRPPSAARSRRGCSAPAGARRRRGRRAGRGCGRRRQAHRERRGQLPHRRLPQRQPRQDRPAGRIRQGGEGGTQAVVGHRAAEPVGYLADGLSTL